jgi:hypothetical protein
MVAPTSPLVTEVAIWRLTFGLGLLLVIVGGIEVVSLWMPPNLAIPAWRVRTAGAFFDTFPQFGLGVVLLLAAAVALGWPGTIRTLATVCILLALALWAVAALYVSALPTVVNGVMDPGMRTQITKATLKTVLQALFYPAAFIILAVLSWRATLARGR